MKCLRRVVASAVSPEVFAFLKGNHEVLCSWQRRLTIWGNSPVVDLMESVQAGLEDFAYMTNIVDLNDLKRQIVVTGAEVNSFGQN